MERIEVTNWFGSTRSHPAVFHLSGGRLAEVRVACDRSELVEQLVGIEQPV